MAILGNGQNMKLNLGLLLLASALLALGSGGTCSAQIGNDERTGLSAPIEGTWIFRIHRVTQGITFTAFQSFTAGGVTLATGTIDRTPPPPISPLYGSWRRTGHNRYVATISFFAFDPAGNAVAMIKNNETFHIVDDSHLSGIGEAFACDTNGENCVDVASPITITGERVVPEGVAE
jgi:hypothetical protein